MRPLNLYIIVLALVAGFFLWGEKRHDVVVSFGSVCCGIDMEANLRLEALVSRFERSHPGQVRVKKAPWGMEGEVDYCIDLRGMPLSQRNEFAREARGIVAASTLHTVTLREGSICKPHSRYE